MPATVEYFHFNAYPRITMMWTDLAGDKSDRRLIIHLIDERCPESKTKVMELLPSQFGGKDIKMHLEREVAQFAKKKCPKQE